ncbi:alpha/beta hydrolase family protein [Pelagibius litoralis]|uniref:alpha/beta hydrolase family protein n=1 Tax=Pelagibius litoralis TaxID=374515 RepID=UPI002AC3435B|nr:prolyl oligopeptidase family serine peptidase [Pelagibius litoralis]
MHGHQFPERPGGRGRLTPPLIERLTGRGWIAAAVSQPGYGGSSGPPDCCGPRTQAALRIAFRHLVERGADPTRSIVWGISRGAVAASCAFVDGAPEPGVLVLQSGTYDMEGWVSWVRAGAPGGNAELANAILANQEREAGRNLDALRARSGVVQAPRGRCDVLIVHGARDPQAPSEDRARMLAALQLAGRRVETAVMPEGEHALPPRFAMEALAEHWPHLAP